MSIPGLGTLKTWGLILLSIGASILFALLGFEKAGRAKEKLKGEIQARKTGQAANEAMMDGLNNEQIEIKKARTGNAKRDGFK